MESDPHVLIALVSATLETAIPVKASVPIVQGVFDGGNSPDDILPNLVPPPAPEGTQKTLPRGATLPSTNTATGDHAVDSVVLDAIASICVSTYLHPVAVALETDISKQVAVLTVAISVGTAHDLIAYLEGLWRLMGLISARCEQLRQQADKTISAPPGLSIPITEGAELWRSELIKRVYRYCISQHFYIFNNQCEALRYFLQSFENSFNFLYGDLILKRKLTDGIYSFLVTRDWLRIIASGSILREEQWRDLIYLMDATVIEIGSVLDDPTLCETWTAELKYNPQLPIRRILGELIALHRHIHNLLHFACSPQSRTTLLCKPTVLVIPRHPTVSVSLPPSQMCWQSLIEAVCGDNLIANYSWLNEQVGKVQGTHHGDQSVNVHGVCALIAHLESSTRISQQSTYIGASLLICASCDAWIHAFNSLDGRQYRTRGTTGEWSFPWGMPELTVATKPEKAKFSTHMTRRATTDFVKFWTAKGQLNAASDHPVATDTGAGNQSLALDPVKRRQELVLEQQRRRSRRY